MSNFIKIFYYILAACIALVVLFFVEGMLTLGAAFYFEEYSPFGWMFQVVAVALALSASVVFTYENMPE